MSPVKANLRRGLNPNFAKMMVDEDRDGIDNGFQEADPQGYRIRAPNRMVGDSNLA
jgi:hypothetical protein